MTRTPRAFTLIELLVVIAIIAILMAIMMPALSRVKDQARDQACRANLKSVGLGVHMYLQDQEFVMPDMHTHTGNTNGHLWWDDAGDPLRASDNQAYWGIAFHKYLEDREVFGCAAFRQDVHDATLLSLGTVTHQMNCADALNWLEDAT